MVDFVQQAGPGDLVAVAVKDTASDQLSAETVQSLQGLGLSNLTDRFRWSQAGNRPALDSLGGATASEEVDGLRAAGVGIGAGWREPAVAAQVEWLKLERTNN